MMTPLYQLLLFSAILSLCLSRSAPTYDKTKRAVNAVSTVSESDKQVILAEHNKYRKMVSPTASNMRKMHWNNDLANVAQQWVDNCKSGHDDNYQRRKDVGLGVKVGQNYYWNTNFNWTYVIERWHAEKQYFEYGTGANPAGKTITHYTQVVWGESSLIGCGFRECADENRLTYTCNYAFGNVGVIKPYKLGSPCADCPGNCVDGALCDCPDGMVCKNGGIVNRTSCTCDCENGFSGTYCDTCPDVDDSTDCGTTFPVDTCRVWSNVPDVCPVMCGFCPDKCNGMTINTCQNDGQLVIEDSGCSCQCTDDYSGAHCETSANCDDSTSYCQSVNPNANYGVADCTHSWHGAWLRGKCPTMCSLAGCV